VVPSPSLPVEGARAWLALPMPLPTVGGGGVVLSARPTLPPLVLCPSVGGETSGVASESCNLCDRTDTRI